MKKFQKGLNVLDNRPDHLQTCRNDTGGTITEVTTCSQMYAWLYKNASCPRNGSVLQSLAFSKTCIITIYTVIFMFMQVACSSSVNLLDLKISIALWNNFWRQNTIPNFWKEKLGLSFRLEKFCHTTMKFMNYNYEQPKWLSCFSKWFMVRIFPFLMLKYLLLKMEASSTVFI